MDRRWQDDLGELPMKPLGDPDGAKVPDGLPPVVDAHVHVFPDPVFDAVWRWFDQNAWPVRHKLYSERALSFLFERGISRVFALHYAHRPGMARALNRYVAELARADARVVGFATVLPGEEGAEEILEEAFSLGLRGVKLHCHVQCFSPDAEEARPIYEACARHGRPLVMHAGREPALREYKCDPYLLCSAERVGRVLRDHPGLRLCVPHLGAGEFEAYERLLERHDNLWLDTTMAAAGFFPAKLPMRLLRARPDRVLYGTDFPNLPFAWDRELRALAALRLPEGDLAALLGGNALRLAGLE